VSFICKNPDCTAPINKKGKAYPSAMECPFCDVPLVEIISISEADLSLISNLPYVIAYPLKRALLEKHSLTRINLLRDTFLNYLKYLALITASEFFNSPIKDKKMVALFNRTLTETSFGLWNEFIREALKFLNDSQHKFFCPELKDYYTSVQTGSNRKLYKGEVFVEDSFGETKIIQQKLTGIDSLINFRNRYLGHQQTLDDATYVDLWEQHFPIFKDLLTRMTFCSDYMMLKTEHGETYCLQGDEVKLRETGSQLNTNVWIEDGNNGRLEILPFFVVPGELSIQKEDKEQILVYESYTGKTIKFFSPEGTEKLTSGKILERLNLLLRDKQKEQPYNPETFTKEVFFARIADENKLTLETLIDEKKVIPGVYVHRKEIEIKLKEWIGARASIFFIAAEAGSGKTNLLAEMQRQYSERGLSSLLIRAGRMEKQRLTEQIAYLLNIDNTIGLGAFPILAGTQSEPTFILIDGINEAFNAESLWKEVLELSQLFEPGRIKFVVTARINSKADLDRYAFSEEVMNLIYGENKDRETGIAALTHWLTPLNMEEMKLAWEGYGVKDKSRFKPLFSFDEISGFDRAIYDQINNPLVLRIFLEVYNRKNLPKKANAHLNIWKDWFATFSLEERTFLDLLAAEVWAKGENELFLDDLLKIELLKPFLVSDNINAPYQRLKNLGWISRYIKNLNVCIGFTVEGVLLYIFGKQLQNRKPNIDLQFIDELMEMGSKLHKAGLEAFLSEEALLGNLNLITELIDAGDEKLDICIRPLLHYTKAFGVEATLANLLENTTDNDWRALLKLNNIMTELQLYKLRTEFLENVISRVPFNNKYDSELGFQAIASIDDKKARHAYSKINYYSEFIICDSELLSALGNCEVRFANYGKALKFYQQCLDIEIKTHGGEHPNVASSYSNIGLVWDNKGEYDKALDFYQQCLDIQLKAYGGEHTSVATSYYNMGGVLNDKGEYDKALEFYQQSLDIRLKILGSEHASVARLYNNMGLVWRNIGEYDKALKFNQKSLDVHLKTYGLEHPDVATSHSNMGSVWLDKGEYDRALEFYQQSLDIRLKTLGWEHPYVAISYGNVGLVWDYKGEYDEALEFYQKGLDIKLKTLGEGHPDVAISYNNMGLVWKHKGEYDKALEFYQKGLDIRLKTLGAEHPDVANSFYNVGSLWLDKGEFDRALEFYQQSLDLQLKTLGGEHLYISNSYNNIGVIWDNKGEYDKALEFYQKSLDINLKALGEGHPDVAVLYNNIGVIWNNKGEFDKALTFYQKSLDIELKTLGGQHPDVAKSYNKIGLVLKNKGEYSKAIELFQKGFKILKKGGFPFKIAELYEALGDKQGALNYFLQSACIRKDDPECGIAHEATIESIQNSKRLANELDKLNNLPDWMI
jgi:tetratricopeptide (TPR) repeat protein